MMSLLAGLDSNMQNEIMRIELVFHPLPSLRTPRATRSAIPMQKSNTHQHSRILDPKPSWYPRSLNVAGGPNPHPPPLENRTTRSKPRRGRWSPRLARTPRPSRHRASGLPEVKHTHTHTNTNMKRHLHQVCITINNKQGSIYMTH